MLAWVLIFLAIALIAALCGYTKVAGTATQIAKILFLIFIVLFIASLIMYGTGVNFALLTWAIIFFVIALVAAMLGYSGVAVISADIAKIICVIFLVLFVVSLIVHFVGGTPMTVPPVLPPPNP